jgi:hypothetical protein
MGLSDSYNYVYKDMQRKNEEKMLRLKADALASGGILGGLATTGGDRSGRQAKAENKTRAGAAR